MKVMCIKKQSDFILSRLERYIAVDWDSGAFVIDNPGMREIGIMDCSEGLNPELLHYKKRQYQASYNGQQSLTKILLKDLLGGPFFCKWLVYTNEYL